MDFGYEDGGRMLIVAETVLLWERSVLSAQFCCEVKSALKNSLFKKKHLKDWLAQSKCSTSAHRKCYCHEIFPTAL